MTYKLKIQECPYRTNRGKCTHKYRIQKMNKRKRFCGYKDINECPYYDEWLELKKIDESGLNQEYWLSGDEDGV